MKARLTRNLCEGRKGQAVVEFALILPIFVLLVFGAIELGRGYYCKHLLANAAREGGRRASLPNQLPGDVNDAVNVFLTGVGLGSTWTVGIVVRNSEGVLRTGGLAVAQEGDRVTVTVSSNFHVLVGTIIPGFDGTVLLSEHCTFRHE